MLTIMTTTALWIIINSITTLPFSLSFSILMLSFMISIMSSYSNLLSFSFISLYGSTNTLSNLLMSLTIWITMLMFLVSMKYSFNLTFYPLFSFSVGTLMLIVMMFFYTDQLLLFYIMFEASLFPTLYLILKWGYQPERLQASIYFVMYTICGSLPLLFTIMYLQHHTFNSSMTLSSPFLTTNIELNSYMFNLALTSAFLVKVPMWGVHLWLPKAHVEAPVSGSMILAGILLKLGGYGLIKMFPLTTSAFSKVMNLLLAFNLWGALVVSLTCLYIIDMKSLIAYSSIIHMGMMVVGILSGSTLGYVGAILMMIAHGFSSPAMFSLANLNYEATGSRNMCLQKGVGTLYPLSSLLWFIILCCNMAAPPSLNLASELLICTSMLKLGSYMFLLVGMVTFLSAAYNLYLYSCQQGETTYLLSFSNILTSSFNLSFFMHAIPVFLSLLSVPYFYL